MELSPRERVERAVRGEPLDKIPFTVYEQMLPACAVERRLRNLGACIIRRRPVIASHSPDVRTTRTSYTENGVWLTRTDHETPLGTLTSIQAPAEFTSWTKRHLFSGPEDYDRLIFLIDNEQYEPDYDAFIRCQQAAGDDVFFLTSIGLEPFQHIISGGIMGTERFCIEWMERRDEVLRLYEACVRAARRRYQLLADSPAWMFNYGGNVTVEIIGPEVFETYYLPHYQEAAGILHKKGKLIGCHLDANNRQIAPLVARSDLDYIEAFTPAPDTDMTLAEALAAWNGKCLWINFPSSVHVNPRAEIAATTRALLDAASGYPRFLVGITEDVPPDRWQESFLTIMETIDAFRRNAFGRNEQ
ncbi:MAG: hypothetical protein JXR94_13480 [Candidatus Hydrogenedentes bacterium]|nr:hypothetical protein [Candidatus Hydrogenedentota bacterium]